MGALDGANTTGAAVATPEPSSNGADVTRKLHRMPAARRKRISVMMKKRWAEREKEKGAGRPEIKCPRQRGVGLARA